MGSYIIKCTNLSGDAGTIIADVGFNYSDNLNDINEADIKISGSGSVKRGLMEIGTEVTIKRNAVLEFYGIIDNIDYLEAGTVVFHASGYEIWFAKENGSYANSPWQAVASATIFAAIIAESSYLTAGTVNAGFATDFRLSISQSLWNGITNLAKKTQQDVQIDYTNKEIDILDHRGSSTSVATFNDGIQINNVRVNYGYPLGNHILVFGKGDGTNQITGTANDATSIAKYGRVKRSVIDRSIISTTEANKLADAELAITKDPPQIIDFDLINPNEAISTGDIITLNAADLSNTEVRIVGIERGIRGGREYTTCQVTNPAFKQLIRRRNKIIARLTKDQIDEGSYMQGSTVINTWGAGINAKTNYPLKIGFYVPAGFKDEANNLQINSIVCDFDIDPFNQQYGTASFTGSDPQVQNTSGDTAPDVENSSAGAGAGVSNSSGNTQPDVASNSGSTGPDVENSSGSTGPGVSGTTGNSGNATWGASYGGFSASTGSGTLTDSSWATITDTAAINLSSDLVFYFATFKNTNAINSRTIRMRAYQGGTYYPGSSGTWTEVNAGDFVTIPILMPANLASDDIFVQAQTESGDMDYEVTWNYQIIGRHTHSDGSLATDSHTHSDGTYSAASHLHSDGTYYTVSHSHDDGTYSADSHAHADGTYSAASHGHPDGSYDINAADINHISVGDGVGEAGSVNATGVTIYLDFWNGSSWVNKHSVVVSEIIEEEIDLSDSNTYPDQFGYWRIRVDPNSANADFIQAIVRLKFHIDS